MTISNSTIPENQKVMPINYFWSTSDASLPYVTQALGNVVSFPPSNATRERPPESLPPYQWPCWDPDGQKWVAKIDYRQIELWEKKTGVPMRSSTVALPDTLIDINPNSPYDVWNERQGKWVKDSTREASEGLQNRQRRKSDELTLAGSQIEQLGEIVYLVKDQSVEEYTKLLTEWKTYRGLLNVLNVEGVNTTFPVRPKLIGE